MLPSLIDPQASSRAQRLYRLLSESQGKRLFLAQQECPGRLHHEMEMEYLSQITGELPAIRGLDFIHNDFDGTVERALRWNDRGGAVTICWHTGIDGIGYPESQAETHDFQELLRPGSPLQGKLLRRWEDAVKALRRLQSQDVPVLWRPFHEFDGGWFWWGKGAGEDFIALWRLMLRVFREEAGLHNLIWVLGYCGEVKDGWYPGDDGCDILGSDTYNGVTVQKPAWDRLRALTADKPLAYHECGVIPPLDDLFGLGTEWTWIMPWHGQWLLENNPPDSLKAIYRDERAVTLSRMPAF